MCSVACGEGGTRTRVRQCDAPPPQFGGAPCPGYSTTSEICNEFECPPGECQKQVRKVSVERWARVMRTQNRDGDRAGPEHRKWPAAQVIRWWGGGRRPQTLRNEQAKKRRAVYYLASLCRPDSTRWRVDVVERVDAVRRVVRGRARRAGAHVHRPRAAGGREDLPGTRIRRGRDRDHPLQPAALP